MVSVTVQNLVAVATVPQSGDVSMSPSAPEFVSVAAAGGGGGDCDAGRHR